MIALHDSDDLPCWPDPDLARREATTAARRARTAAPEAPLILPGASQGANAAVRLSVGSSVDDVAAFVAVVGGGALEDLAPHLPNGEAGPIRSAMRCSGTRGSSVPRSTHQGPTATSAARPRACWWPRGLDDRE